MPSFQREIRENSEAGKRKINSYPISNRYFIIFAIRIVCQICLADEPYLGPELSQTELLDITFWCAMAVLSDHYLHYDHRHDVFDVDWRADY